MFGVVPKFTALQRLAKAWHRREEFAAKDGVSKDELELTQFVVCTPCACHDTNKAQECGMFTEFRDRDLLRDVYVAIASIRNAWNLVNTHLGSWVASRLRYTDPLPEAAVSQLETMWAALGVEPGIAATMCDTLQLRFEGGELRVTKECMSIPDFCVVGTVATALLGCWRIQKFTESRWHTVGTSCRAVAVGLLTGLHSLVDYILGEKRGSGFHLNGWYRLTGDRVDFVMSCAMVSRVSDAVMAELLTDARLLRKMETLKTLAQEEVCWLMNVPEFVYNLLADHCAVGPSELMQKRLSAAQVNYAFMHDRFFCVTEQYPYRLAVGDDVQLAQNLEALRVAGEPDEQVTWQLWRLLQMGYSRQRLIWVLQLIRDLEWSTLTAEQLHGYAANLLNIHP